MLLYLALLGHLLVEAAPSTSQTGDLTILSDNDLYNDQSSRSVSAILLHTENDFSSAETACRLLGETLWVPEAQDFAAGLNNSLSYQVYQKAYTAAQRYWVSRNPSCSALCRAIDYQGKLSPVDCAAKLPALCTQSAPVSNFTFADTSAPFQLTQKTGGQLLTGYRDFYSFRFLGVRFAPQPDRFGYSTVFDGEGSFSALEHATKCLQVPGEGSEDCLFLDIWTPFLPSSASASAPGKKALKPVLVSIYGGGFTTGWSGTPDEDGTNLASRGDMVVVGLNHRLGNLGFLALEDGIHNGNYGIGDLVTALEWVKQNIAAFGGDPDRVTVTGESSGAAAVRALMASPAAKGLLAAGIMQSDPAGIPILGQYTAYGTIQEAYEGVTVPVLNQTGCLGVADTVACLRALDGQTLATTSVMAEYPVIDGTYLVNNGLVLNGSVGPGSRIPLLAGTNRDELAIDVPIPTTTNITEAFEVLSALAGYDFLPALSSGLFALPAGPNVTIAIANMTARAITDVGMRCLDEATAYSGAKHGVFPAVYSYVFNRTYQPSTFTTELCQPPATAERPLGDPDAEYFKCHAGEVIYTYGNVLRGVPDRDGLDVPFSQLVTDYWTSFVRTHDPNPDRGYLLARGYHGTLARIREAGRWEAVTAGRPTLRLLQLAGRQIPFFEGEQCRELGYPLDYYEAR